MSRKIYPKTAHGVKGEKPGESIFSKNHFASMMAIPRDVQFEIDRFMLHRVAGNVYECPSTKDFWKVQGNKIVKLVGNEVNQGESIQAAPDDRPAAFLAGILDDLSFD
jgi:hypothetical protein